MDCMKWYIKRNWFRFIKPIILDFFIFRRNFKLENENNFSKYLIVKEYYLDYIKNKKLNDGDLLPSELETSKKFKFSRDTIRRALNELENEGYITRKQGRGTFYNKNNRRFKEKKVTVLTTFVSNYIFPSIISGIEEIVSSRHYTLNLASSNNDPALEKIHLQKIIDFDVDGLIIEPARSAEKKESRALFEDLQKKNIPFVMINAMYKDLNPAYVVLNDLKGEYMATKYLLQLGHRKIAGIFKKDDLQGVYRKKGFLKALKEYDVDESNIIIGEYRTNEMATYGYYFTDKIIKDAERPTAIVCYNDEIAVDVIEALNDNKITVPDDISVLGFDDSVLATTGNLRLTTIKHPKTAMGKMAARLLFNMIEMGSNRPNYIYEPELIVRSSCKEIKQ